MLILDFETSKKLIEKFGIKPSCPFAFVKKQTIRKEIIEKYGHLSDDGFYELTEDCGGSLKFDEVYVDEVIVEYKKYTQYPVEFDVITYDDFLDMFDEIGIHVIIKPIHINGKLCYTMSIDSEKHEYLWLTTSCETIHKTRNEAFEKAAEFLIK